MKKLKYYLFYLMAATLAPFEFRPRKCYVPSTKKCRLWNCCYYSAPSCICNSKIM